MDNLVKILATARAGPRGSDLPTTNDIFHSVALSVKEQMAEFDASHDFEHVLRVTALAQSIFAAEITHASSQLDLTAILLAALLHDITDKKYTKEGTGESILTDALHAAAVPAALSGKIIAVVNAVSYSTEKRDPERTQQVLLEHPELGVVQDADRLDAIGAIGIGRAFTFGGAKMPLKSMQLSREHMTEKLDKLMSIMKTETGRKLAEERTERIRIFCAWWDEEARFMRHNAEE
ncbi:hypothetical protein NLG97_g6502 [Lecanicillium saksenae]|uniref:Uncharacterized protein n=1 Tax=Lecanicillium saksenae TaxID=468837 RepID=A0ACC1QRB1_9HYPO|nr:hypothetical protein NLG97_g6502 [Lecanicillium saksenae]